MPSKPTIGRMHCDTTRIPRYHHSNLPIVDADDAEPITLADVVVGTTLIAGAIAVLVLLFLRGAA